LETVKDRIPTKDPYTVGPKNHNCSRLSIDHLNYVVPYTVGPKNHNCFRSLYNLNTVGPKNHNCSRLISRVYKLYGHLYGHFVYNIFKISNKITIMDILFIVYL